MTAERTHIGASGSAVPTHVEKGMAIVQLWIAAAAALTFLWARSWFAAGDFQFPQAMLYHSVSVPLLVLFFLLTASSLPVRFSSSREFVVLAVAAALLAGVGSLFDRQAGLSLASVGHIVGMFAADLAGVVLAVDVLRAAVSGEGEFRRKSAALWLLATSVVAVLLAAPLGHLAGWGVDVGLTSFPGVSALLAHTGMTTDAFQEGLVSSHSHLIVAAVLCGLTALAALRFGYDEEPGWRAHLNRVGLWMSEVGLVALTVVYLISALTGWEPPALFASDPNGMPLDDVVLTVVELGFLALAVGLSGRSVLPGEPGVLKVKLRTTVRWNWVLGFVAAVVLGIYIEFHEIYYGGGSGSAPGAVKDLVFIRAHLVLPFLLLPVLLAFSLALAGVVEHYHEKPGLVRAFTLISLVGMALAFVGELVWFAGGSKAVFMAGVAVLVAALAPGAWCVAHAAFRGTKAPNGS